MTIKGNNKYNFEGTETGKTWTFHVKDNNNLVTEHIAAKLKDFAEPIYFNDNSAKHCNMIEAESKANITVYDIGQKFDLLWSKSFPIKEAHAARRV